MLFSSVHPARLHELLSHCQGSPSEAGSCPTPTGARTNPTAAFPTDAGLQDPGGASPHEDPGSLTCRGDFAREAARWVVPLSQLPSLLSSSTRVLGTKLQERPRAGFSGPVLLSLVTWLVTCSTNRLFSAWEKQGHTV